MSSYLNKLQTARKIAVEKYLADNGIKYTVVKRGRVKYYVLLDDKRLPGVKWTSDELVNWFEIEVKVKE